MDGGTVGGAERGQLAVAVPRRGVGLEAEVLEDGIEAIDPVLSREPEASAYRVLASLFKAADRTDEQLAALEKAAKLEAFFENIRRAVLLQSTLVYHSLSTPAPPAITKPSRAIS